MDASRATPELQTDRAHSARIYDHLLGGKDNYAVDRDAAQQALSVFPTARTAARANRAFMHRAVRHVARAGIRQFLDIGTGIPTEPNLHQIAQAVDPTARIVYVDDDPIVLAHAAALMVGDPRGRTGFVQADARQPDAVLEAPALRDVLDLDEPVALSLVAMLHFIDDDATAAHLVGHLLDRLVPGSYLLLTHVTLDIDPETIAASQKAYDSAGVRGRPRSRDEITALFLDGLDVLEPGIVVPQRWRPDQEVGDVADTDVPVHALVARKR